MLLSAQVFSRTCRTVATMAFCALMSASSAAAQPAQQDEFVPISQLPPQEQLPAAPLLVGAYVVVLVALFVYVVSVARRIGVVHGEVAKLEGELKTRKRV